VWFDVGDTKADLEKLLKAGVPRDAAIAIVRRLKGVGTEKELLRALGFR